MCLPNSHLHLLFEGDLCGTRFRAFVFERSITTARQPIQRFETACDVTFFGIAFGTSAGVDELRNLEGLETKPTLEPQG